jgi:prepilin-type N-terminal cleavage/methylation domain-containing protein
LPSKVFFQHFKVNAANFSLSLTDRIAHHINFKPMKSSPVTHPSSNLDFSRKLSAFTLIELLVVIAIIAILAGLAFPAVQGAMGSAKKAQARNEVNQLAAAVKAYQLEYGRLPGSATADGPAPADFITTLTSSNSQNPRGIVFFEPKIAKGQKNGLGTDGKTYYDPWGSPYTITLDYDYNNKIATNNRTNFTTVIVTSTGGSTNTNSIISNIK